MPTFKQYHKNNVLIGTGTYKFRPYTVLSATVSLTATLSGCTMSPAVTTINRLGETTLTFVASTNYRLPTSVQVTGATAVSWDQNTGKLVIEKPTGDSVNVKVAATKITYSITANLTNVTKSSGPSSIEAGGTATLVFAAADNYELPDTVTVVGATSNWTQSTGTLVLSAPTGPVTVTIAGVYLLKVIAAGTYTLKDEPSVTATHAQFAFTTNSVAGSGIAVDSAGITYTLASPMGATKVYTAATKAWTLASYKTVTLAAEAHVSEAFNTWWTANVLEKLSTPINVTVDGKTVSWDEVPNATKYLIKLDGTEVGTTTGGAVSDFAQVTPTLVYEGYTFPDYAELSDMDTQKVYTIHTEQNIFPKIVSIQYSDSKWISSHKSIWIKTQSEDTITFVYDASLTNGVGQELYNNMRRLNVIILKGNSIAAEADFEGLTSPTPDFPSYFVPCYSKGSKITLADGSTKNVEDITYDDELLVWNFYEGKFDSAKPIWVKKPQTINYFLRMHFSNGSTLELIGPGEVAREDGVRAYHRIYNNEAQKFTYTGFEDTPIGIHTFADDGSFPKLLQQDVIHEPVEYYNIITDKHFNVFVNGICTSCVLSNKYEIQNMKYVGERLISEENEQKYYEHLKEIDLNI